MLSKWSQDIAKCGPDGLWNPFDGWERFQDRFSVESAGQFLKLKLIQNCSKVDQNSKNADSETTFEFDTMFWSILDQIVIDFEVKMRPNLLSNFNMTCNMLNLLKC